MDSAEHLTNSRSSRTFRLAGGFVLLTAAALRIAATTGDLAMDEVWSWWFVKNVVRSPWEVFQLRHDNNHILNTMIIVAFGPDAAGAWYRLPAALASIGTVVIAMMMAYRLQRELGALVAGVLVGSSALLILHGTEARGYGYALFFAFLAWECLRRLAEKPAARDALFVAIACSLGIMSHLTFTYALAGFGVWAALNVRRVPVRLLILACLPPLIVGVWLYLNFIRGMAIGGGPETSVTSAIILTLSLAAGGSSGGDLALVSAILFVVFTGFGWWSIWQTRRADAACYVTIILLAPALVLLATGHALIYPRYFFIPLGFALLLISNLLTDCLQRSRIAGGFVVVVMVAYLAGNSWWNYRLFDHGRGDYSAALTWLAAQNPDHQVTISSDHDFRNGMLYSYFAPRLQLDGKSLGYVDQRSLPSSGTNYVILHDFAGDEPYPDTLTDRYGNPYTLDRVFRHNTLTGWNWWVYRRAN